MMTESERDEFVALLVKAGWSLRDGTVWSPSNGLWFGGSHFSQWSPKEFAEVFSRRADRIEKAKVGEWECSIRENRQACDAAQTIERKRNAQPRGGG